MKPIARAALATTLALGVAACGQAKPPREFVDRQQANVSRLDETSHIGDLFEYDRATGGESGGGILVNKHLWNAALDTLAFLPTQSTDPFSGVIATEWSTSPQAPNERMKVAAFIQGLKLEAQSLRVAVYREVRNEAGVWVTAPVSAATPRRLEDLILTRARQMRIAELEQQDKS